MPQRKVLREPVKAILLQRIISGEYPPGSRLVETRIAQELGVSQAPVREALRDLEQVGAVEHQPFRGCSVRALDMPELLEAFPVRAALESLAARMAAERISEDELERLSGLLDEMAACAGQGDELGVGAANAAFHETIVEAAGNGTLERQWRQLQPHLRTVISLTLPRPGRSPDAWRAHQPIFDALGRHDPDAAADAAFAHLMAAADLLRPPADVPNGEETA
jgi:DNA-binding GntR family transcriptional regulator